MPTNAAKDGHSQLILDLSNLLKRALKFEFHDFKSEIATPKMELVTLLDRYLRKAKNGHYDNSADESDVAELEKILRDDGASEEFIDIVLGEDRKTGEIQ